MGDILKMNKEEFLQKMRVTLTGEVSDFVISDNISYYSNYIDTEIASGKSEDDVLDMLGDPRLLAKTIIELHGADSDSNGNSNGYNSNNSNGYDFSDSVDSGNSGNSGAYEEFKQQGDHNYGNGAGYSMKGGIFGIKGCLVSILVLVIFFIILKFVLSAALYFAIPICIILLVAGLIKNLRR